MFKNIFGKVEDTLLPATQEVQVEPRKVIDSAHIQNDIDLTFGEVLKQFDLLAPKEGNIEELNNKIKLLKAENVDIYSKIEKLKKFGFVNTPSVTKTLKELELQEQKVKNKMIKIEKEVEQSRILQTQIAEYKLKYPSYKFVDNDTMVEIMKKYDLVLGNTFMYAREIPDRALNIIDGFSEEISKSNQVIQMVITSRSHWDMGMRYNHCAFRIKQEERKVSDHDAFYEAHLMQQRNGFIERVQEEFNVTKLKMIAPLSHFQIPTRVIQAANGKKKEVPIVKLNLETREFEFNGDEANKFSEANKEVLDPIACLQVKGGFIILDAWDKEAEIPEIKNPILN